MKFLIIFPLIIVLGIFTLVYSFGEVVPPGKIGVRQIGFGPGKGFHDGALQPGYHWGDPTGQYSRIHLVPDTVQTIHLHRDQKKHPETLGPLEVQTTDGATVLVDVTLLAQFLQEPNFEDGTRVSGGPADLLKEVGLSEVDWFNRIKRNAEDELRRALGSLSTEEFYNPELREHEKVRTARKRMNDSLKRFGISVVGVLIRRYTYAADEIDRAVAQKNLQIQEERLNSQESLLAAERAKVAELEADYVARIKTAQIRAKTDAEVIRSEGDLLREKLTAEGDLLVAQAKADADRLRAKAFEEGIGAEVYLAKELAPLLSSLKGGVVRDLDPYNLPEWLSKLGVGNEKRVPGE